MLYSQFFFFLINLCVSLITAKRIILFSIEMADFSKKALLPVYTIFTDIISTNQIKKHHTILRFDRPFFLTENSIDITAKKEQLFDPYL